MNNELSDRSPDFQYSENLEINKLEDSEQYKAMSEMMEKFSMLSRKDKRKIFKPTFSANVRLALRKPVSK